MPYRLSEVTRAARGDLSGHECLKWIWLLMKHEGRLMEAADEADRLFKYSVPSLGEQMRRFVKAAIAGGTPTDQNWAGSLIPQPTAIFADWVVKQSKLGAYGAVAAAAVRTPFDTRVVVDSGEPTAGFVGFGRAIPVARLSLDGSTQLSALKVALVLAFAKELFKIWSPATQRNLDDRLTTAVVRGRDAALLDPSVSAVEGERPASLLNGISPLSSAGTTAANMATDVETLVRPQLDGGADPSRLVLVYHPDSALSVSLADHQVFRNMGATGGTVAGINAVATVSSKTSTSPTEKLAVCIDASKVQLADDGVVSFSSSDKVSLEMSDDPSGASGSPPNPVSVVSMFQTESIALKCVLHVNWRRVRDDCVTWMVVNY